jgi:hypothetical protein
MKQLGMLKAGVALCLCGALQSHALLLPLALTPSVGVALSKRPAPAPKLVLQAGDIHAIRAAVQGQLDAFAADDGDKAFGLSSADTRLRFGSPDNFLRVVRKYYPAIYRHRRVLFSPPELVDGNAIQLVNVVDAINHVWVAVYRLERDAAGAWKIDGCRLQATTGISM